MKTLITLLLACALSIPAFANEEKKEGEGEGAAPQVIYHTLTPALVGNFGTGPKLKYYKACLLYTSDAADE